RRRQEVPEPLERVQDDQVRLEGVEAGTGEQVAQVAHQLVAGPQLLPVPARLRAGVPEHLAQFLEARRERLAPVMASRLVVAFDRLHEALDEPGIEVATMLVADPSEQ